MDYLEGARKNINSQEELAIQSVSRAGSAVVELDFKRAHVKGLYFRPLIEALSALGVREQLELLREQAWRGGEISQEVGGPYFASGKSYVLTRLHVNWRQWEIEHHQRDYVWETNEVVRQKSSVLGFQASWMKDEYGEKLASLLIPTELNDLLRHFNNIQETTGEQVARVQISHNLMEAINRNIPDLDRFSKTFTPGTVVISTVGHPGLNSFSKPFKEVTKADIEKFLIDDTTERLRLNHLPYNKFLAEKDRLFEKRSQEKESENREFMRQLEPWYKRLFK